MDLGQAFERVDVEDQHNAQGDDAQRQHHVNQSVFQREFCE
jgi:hypothetical protein